MPTHPAKIACRSIPIGLALIWTIAGCSGRSNPPAVKPTASKPTEPQLTLNNATFEEANADGTPVWRVVAQKSRYEADKQSGQIEGLRGDLYQDGKIFVRLTAQQAQIERDGKVVRLRGDVTAIETRNSLQVRGQEVEWRPEEDILIVRQNISGLHPQLILAGGREARYFSRRQLLEMTGRVEAVSKEPRIVLKTTSLAWQVAAETIATTSFTDAVRFLPSANNTNSSTPPVPSPSGSNGNNNSTFVPNDRLQANRLEYRLKEKTLTADGNVTYVGVQPALNVRAASAIWQVAAERLEITRQFQGDYPPENTTFSAARGQYDLKQNIVRLEGNARVVSIRNNASIVADRLRWRIDNQEVAAVGNITYNQTDPPLTTRGNRAIGKLQDQTIVVSSDNNRQVETEFQP
jgi:LPS export ABC transporter protein LptC